MNARTERATEPEWAGDDQEWWDWYMSLAVNSPVQSAGPTEAPSRPPVRPATPGEVAGALDQPYPLADRAVERFRRRGHVRLPEVIPPAVLAALAERTDQLLGDVHGLANPGRFLALEQLWLTDPLLRSVALSRRLGDLAARLLGADRVRLYHDNVLSKEPGCGRTPWHRDADHYPLDSPAVCTSWIPLHDVPAGMGPLACLDRTAVPPALAATPAVADRAYDGFVAATLRAEGVTPVPAPYRAGEVSFHAADCFHTAGPNRTDAPRRVLSATYYADGTRVVAGPTAMSGRWTDFLPGVAPGGPAASPLNPVVGILG
ncbi:MULTISPECIES: phytanoyl-CoA dioxygenase family protein [unclassified Kitasatospora]|uniref:phytanoyl-CoA dioxygenase family protein n=1 Tax=unclassified Kitasatospora TaxID=2633591 RepID=UPI00070E1AC1|nr:MULTISPECIES: phytanoyl-CoA dioxygenase family protein [unclassified Kitasatospora]